jgi:ribonuclease BN (tRNA processing enzyme)
MVIELFGTASGHTSRSRNHTGILIRGKTTLLIDCGAPVAQLLLRKDLPADAIDVLWLTHGHSDHVGQFPSLLQHLWLQGRKKPLQIFGPAPLLRHLKAALPHYLLFPKLLGFPIRWNGLSGSRTTKPVKVGNLTLTPFPTSHLQDFQQWFKKSDPDVSYDCLALTISDGKHTLAFSADIGSALDLLPALEHPLDLLICEIAHVPHEELFSRMAAGSIKTLVLTHYGDPDARQGQAIVRLARRLHAAQKVVFAKDGLKVDLHA